MKKIIFTMFLASTTLLFAKTENPKFKSDLPKEERKVLVAKKTIENQEKEMKKIALVTKQIEVHPCIVASVAPVPTNLPALLACLASISDSLHP